MHPVSEGCLASAREKLGALLRSETHIATQFLHNIADLDLAPSRLVQDRQHQGFVVWNSHGQCLLGSHILRAAQRISADLTDSSGFDLAHGTQRGVPWYPRWP